MVDENGIMDGMVAVVWWQWYGGSGMVDEDGITLECYGDDDMVDDDGIKGATMVNNVADCIID
jgi:hypothetical protein